MKPGYGYTGPSAFEVNFLLDFLKQKAFRIYAFGGGTKMS